MSDNTSTRTGATPDLYAEPAWLATHLNDPDVRIVEVDVSRAAYDQGHIPGAVLWNCYTDLHHADYSPEKPEEFADLLGRSGIAPTDTVVFYGYAPFLGFWLLKAYGHQNARVLQDTRDGWRDAGRPWTTETANPVSATYAIPDATPSLMSLEALQNALGTDTMLILDVRSDAEYVGERFWPSGATEGAGRAGHMPGVVHLNIDLLRTAPGVFKNEAELRSILQTHGVTPDQSIVTYCTIGNRASEVAAMLKYLLGYPDVRVYIGSWAEWGTHADTPVEPGEGVDVASR